ncbi:MAG: arginine--tRNA ligase [candidate division KSB1 bacterium]|nr:arginine--tRNA ligase [candidate division KSB1 bacterium]MDZ7335307.1 arginine--tRNA ligase [candidate division KSB1 bacterium]MDZ7357231.1 arginine--tRNA ligase [candidate division KSB1 bacterium]MDZ7375139.1 arginine--tRNA ligase [candidate division KSB1 bacterium]MDZ7399080.1 arginine--tRNA ligase [candidate division KSB1 bacterium]
MIDIEQYLQNSIATALRRLSFDPSQIMIKLEPPKQNQFGDLACNIALQLASQQKRAPRAIAEAIMSGLELDPGMVEKVEIAGPGFINFHLGWGYYRQALLNILHQGTEFGQATWGNGVKMQIEFVSANPTGPLNVVSARAAAVGDVMVNLYRAVGFAADREYYINDAGRQVRLLGASVSSRYMELFGHREPFPEEGYHGEYVKDLAKEIADEYGDRFCQLTIDERQEQLSKIALEKMIALHQQMMQQYGVKFDTWFPESQLRAAEAHLAVLRELEQAGYTYQEQGAIWFRSTLFGDEKDRVLITSEGEPTYFLVDIAYHRNKYQRGYEKLYDIWGPDHHGYIPRMAAAIQALGYPKDSFHVEIVQQVNLLRAGEVVKMSKRAGQIITMEELIQEVGVDAARFFFVNRKCSSHLDFDIDLAKKQSDENPVYYVQYAHARIFNIIKFAEQQGYRIELDADLTRLQQEEERLLIKRLLQYPEIISRAAQFWEPHLLTNYLQELAAVFHHFYQKHRVVTEDAPLTRARLLLCQATQIVFANGLRILGITAPERM